MIFDPRVNDRSAPRAGKFVQTAVYPRPIRFLEVAVAVVLLLGTLPLTLLIAAAIKIDSRDPVFESEERLARGRRFKLLKFRTTTIDMQGRQSVKPLGQFLHYTRIEALPYLINLLRGDVGFADIGEYLLTE